MNRWFVPLFLLACGLGFMIGVNWPHCRILPDAAYPFFTGKDWIEMPTTRRVCK